MSKQEKNQPHTPEQTLDAILATLNKFEKREKRKDIISFVVGCIRIVPMIATLFFMWQLYTNGDQILDIIVDKAAEKSRGIAVETTTVITDSLSPDELLERLKGYVPN